MFFTLLGGRALLKDLESRDQIPNFDDFLLQDPDSLSKTAFGLYCVYMSY